MEIQRRSNMNKEIGDYIEGTKILLNKQIKVLEVVSDYIKIKVDNNIKYLVSYPTDYDGDTAILMIDGKDENLDFYI